MSRLRQRLDGSPIVGRRRGGLSFSLFSFSNIFFKWAAQLSPAPAEAHADVFGADTALTIGAVVLSLLGRVCLIGLSFFAIVEVDPAVVAGAAEVAASELEGGAPLPADAPLPAPPPLPPEPLPTLSELLPPRSSILGCDLGCGFSGSVYES